MRNHRVLVPLFFGTVLGVTPAIHAQTDVALSVFGAFNQSTRGNDTNQSPSNQAGAIAEVRHIKNPLVGFEATYSFNRANQNYSLSAIQVTPNTVVSGSASNNAHEVTADWVVSLKVAHIRPFALAGGGLLVNVPSGATVSTCSQFTVTCITESGATNISATGLFVYGAGLDWGLLPHLGLRLQYRGNVYKAPALIGAFHSTSAFTQSAEPMIGAYFRF